MQKRIFSDKKIVCMPQNFDDKVLFNKQKKKKSYELIDDKYKYKKNWLVCTWQFILYYFIAKPLFLFYGKVFLGIKVYGKKKIKHIKGGAITVSNHVHFLDFSIATNFIGGFRRSHIISNKENFDVPFAGKLAAAYGVMPLPDTPKAKINFYNQVNEFLKKGRFIHLFPEASMWPYYTQLRPFKRGAFHFSSRNNLPVIPYVLVFRKSKGFERIFRRKPRISVYICDPIYPNLELNKKEQNLDLQRRTYAEMQKVLEQNKSYEFWKYIPESEFKEKYPTEYEKINKK